MARLARSWARALLAASLVLSLGCASTTEPHRFGSTYGRQIGSGSGSGVPAGTRVTASVDQASLTFSGLSGSADGGYEIYFEWFAGTGGDTNLILQLNGVTTGYNSSGMFATASGVLSDLQVGNTGLGSGTATTTGFDVARGGASGRDHAMGHIRLLPTTGGNTLVIVESSAFAGSTGAQQSAFSLRGVFPSATITSAVLLTSNASSTGIKQNSYGDIRALGWSS